MTRASHGDGLPVHHDLRPAHLAVDEPEGDDLCAVQDRGARLLRGEDVLEAEPRVVRPRVGIQRARAQPVETELWHELLRAIGRDEPVEAGPGESRVEEDPALHEGRAERAVPVERQEKREAVHEVRGDVGGQGTPLVVGLAHEADVAEAQVAEPAVDELRRRARRPRAEVARVDEGHRETRAGCVGGRRRADHAPADDEQVERRARERLACGGPPLDRR